jgi:hypothetical protein
VSRVDSSVSKRTRLTRGTTIGRIVFLLWVLTVTGVCTRVALTRTPGRQDVFPVYQNAGRCWLAGQDLYHHAKFDYRYSPTFAATLAPAAFLSPKLGSIAWRLLSIGIFLTALAWTSRVEIPDKFAREGRPFIFLFVLPLALGNLNDGQANLFVIGALLASIAAVTCDRWSFAAVALVAAATIKLYPLVFALLLVLVFPRKLGWRVALCLPVAAGLPFLFQRPDYVARQCHHWFQYLQTEDRSGRPPSEWYSDLRLLFRVWLVPLSTTGYLIIQIASGAALAGLAVWGRLHGWPRPNLLGWLLSLTCCWMTVLGPATESST